MKTTSYFDFRVRLQRAEIKQEWCEAVVANPIEVRAQSNGWIRHWGYVESVKKYLRVVTLADGETFHKAFFDRDYEESAS